MKARILLSKYRKNKEDVVKIANSETGEELVVEVVFGEIEQKRNAERVPRKIMDISPLVTK